jgi:hypothetical protein
LEIIDAANLDPISPLPIGATGIVASIYWRSAGIPIINSSAEFLEPSLPRFAYSAGHYLLILLYCGGNGNT